MTQEEKELLLKDLCARLPYGVKVKANLFNDGEVEFVGTLKTINLKKDWFEFENIMTPYHLEELKPFLRPMSSMTEEEKAEFELLGWRVDELDNNHPWAHGSVDDTKGVDFLNSHHFDFRDLIGKGLAIAVTEKNNPYA